MKKRLIIEFEAGSSNERNIIDRLTLLAAKVIIKNKGNVVGIQRMDDEERREKIRPKRAYKPFLCEVQDGDLSVPIVGNVRK